MSYVYSMSKSNSSESVHSMLRLVMQGRFFGGLPTIKCFLKNPEPFEMKIYHKRMDYWS